MHETAIISNRLYPATGPAAAMAGGQVGQLFGSHVAELTVNGRAAKLCRSAIVFSSVAAAKRHAHCIDKQHSANYEHGLSDLA